MRPAPLIGRANDKVAAVLFPTTDFAIFFAVVFLGHWLLNPNPLRWKLFMIAASYVFYAWWNVHFIWLLAGVSDDRAAGRDRRAAAGGRTEEALDPRDRRRARVRTPRLLQVLRLLLTEHDQRGPRPGPSSLAAPPPGAPARRRLVLHVHGDRVRRRRLPRSLRRGVVDRRVPLPLVLPPPRRGSHRPAERADPAARHQARPTSRGRVGRRLPDPRRAVQEGRHLELHRHHDRRSRVRGPGPPQRPRGAVRRVRVRRA